MKKAIKDLTREEIKRICNKQIDKNQSCCGPKGCCPLYYMNVTKLCLNIPLEIKKFEESINEEVEIPEVEV